MIAGASSGCPSMIDARFNRGTLLARADGTAVDGTALNGTARRGCQVTCRGGDVPTLSPPPQGTRGPRRRHTGHTHETATTGKPVHAKPRAYGEAPRAAGLPNGGIRRLRGTDH